MMHVQIFSMFSYLNSFLLSGDYYVIKDNPARVNKEITSSWSMHGFENRKGAPAGREPWFVAAGHQQQEIATFSKFRSACNTSFWQQLVFRGFLSRRYCSGYLAPRREIRC